MLQPFQGDADMDLRAIEFEQAAVTLAWRFSRPTGPGIFGSLQEENGELLAVRHIQDVPSLVANVTRIKRDGGRPAITFKCWKEGLSDVLIGVT